MSGIDGDDSRELAHKLLRETPSHKTIVGSGIYPERL
jgi:hypothetical protein